MRFIHKVSKTKKKKKLQEYDLIELRLSDRIKSIKNSSTQTIDCHYVLTLDFKDIILMTSALLSPTAKQREMIQV